MTKPTSNRAYVLISPARADVAETPTKLLRHSISQSIFTAAKQNALVVTRKTKRNQGADHGR